MQDHNAHVATLDAYLEDCIVEANEIADELHWNESMNAMMAAEARWVDDGCPANGWNSGWDFDQDFDYRPY